MNVRVKFKKGEEIKYISHLDLMRTFQRMMKRSGLDIKYSEGYNPHILLTFALPLPVGVTSDGEYAQFQLIGNRPLKEISDKLSAAAPAGIQIIETTDSQAPEFKEINRASYQVEIETDTDIKALLDVINQNEINVVKKSKKGPKEINIKPLIFSCTAARDNKNVILKLVCAAGSERNLNPQLLIDAFFKYICGFATDYYTIHRTELIFPRVYEF